MQSKRKSNSKKGRSQLSGDDVVWPFLIYASFCLLLFPSLVLCVCGTLLPTLIICLSTFFLFMVEVSPPMIGRTLEEETVAALSVEFPNVEEEPPKGDIAKEAGQPMQGVQAIQDPEASQLPTSQSPQLEQTPSPIRACSLRRC